MKIKIPTFSLRFYFLPTQLAFDSIYQYSVGQVNRFGIHPDNPIDFIKWN